jgi:enoyl-CoA hydratase/carnithine racemase
MSYEQLLYERDGAILTIQLNRPDKLNAFTTVMMHELLDAFDRADADDEVKAVILTGAGRAFCAGADISSGASAFKGGERSAPGIDAHRDGGGLVSLRIFESKKPVISAINGAAVGVGVTMTLPTDIRIASGAARMGFVFARRGIVPEACSSWFLPRVVGISQAAEWVYTGRIFGAEEALAGRLVSRVVAPDELLDTARQIATEIASNSSAVSVALSRQMLWRMLGAEHPMDAHEVDSRCIYHMAQSADAKEGVESFFEKRPPQFRMRPSADMPPFYPWWKERRFRG